MPNPGEVLDERFELERVAGTGGMGTVYRARDRATGEPVAIKILRAGEGHSAARFVREIRVLAALHHPGIVRYVADGRTRAGELWLAMEWLDGEGLNQRLARKGLTSSESLELARRVGEALGAAHDRGITHRDVKPSNIMLDGGDLARVKLLDFGVARVEDARQATRTGVMIGTPGYMAPEQVRGASDVGPRADVFAVGCLLFECLTGRVAFVGDNIMAVLAKILLEDAPRVSELRPELPPAIDALVARAMAKLPEHRPANGAQLAAELAALGAMPIGATPAPPAAELAPRLTASERRLLCVVLIAGPERPADATIVEPLTDAPTQASDSGGDATISEHAGGEATRALRQVALAHGAKFDRLVDGSHVVTLYGTGSAADQAMQAARCALALKALAPLPAMALATGRGVMAGGWPVGEAIDRAARLLEPARRSPARVRIDEVTAGLLDARFELGGDDAGLALLGERDVVEVTRTLLGRPTPCVGRDRELAVLVGLFEQAASEPIARAVLVTGPAGIGKSRVRFELLARL
ncbi:MAG TPA: protein kinase, partial [Kofleriaceae bacterium]|nr:protein kinase [Kofleriaceae bacterium]